MRTSPSQFETLVTYMEQHGDLNKLSSNNIQAKISNIRNWEELTLLLNSDGAGVTKTTEKWKKAWSDFKNNTKKKVARLHRAARGTGGRPAVYAKLSGLEQRVLSLMGLKVATGLAVAEAELSQEVHVQPGVNNDDEQGTVTPHQLEESSDSQSAKEVETIFIASSGQSPPSPSLRATPSPPLMFIKQEVESSQPNSHEPGPSRLSIVPAHSPPERPATAVSHITLVELQVEEAGLLSPTSPSTQVQDGHGHAPSGQTSPRRARRTQGSTRRRTRPAHSERAAQQFLRADSFWRKFKVQQHRDNIKLRSEQNRIRELEVQAQRGWQALGRRFINILEKVADKYCKD